MESGDGDSFLRVGIDDIVHALLAEDGFSTAQNSETTQIKLLFSMKLSRLSKFQ